MHSLEVIVIRNARAAGREDAHDGRDENPSDGVAYERPETIAAYLDGYAQGKSEA